MLMMHQAVFMSMLAIRESIIDVIRQHIVLKGALNFAITLQMI